MKTYFAVTGIVRYKDKILILKKSPDDYNFPNRWSFCSGYIKEFESADDTVLREIKEETGLKAKILKKGKLFLKKYPALDKEWHIMPFLCEVYSNKIHLDHENTDFKWINYKDIVKYKTVPGLRKDLKVLGLM